MRHRRRQAPPLAVLAAVSILAAITAPAAPPAGAIELIGVTTGVGPGTFGNSAVSFAGSGSDDLLRIDPATGAVTLVGAGLPSGIHNFAAALDAAGDRYFYQTAGSLHVVDAQTGALVVTHPLPHNLLGLEFDPASGLLFGVVLGLGPGTFGNSALTLDGSGANDLISIDPVSGAIVTVGTGLPSGMRNFAAALDPGSARYFYVAGAALHVVDRQTGALTVSHPLPENVHGLAFDPPSGLLVGVVLGLGPGTFGNSEMSFAGSGANDLVAIDPVAGTAAVLGTGLPSGGQNFAAAVDPAAGIYFYRAGGDLVSVDLATAAVVATVAAPDNYLALEAPFIPAPPVLEVVIDVKPGSDPNSVNPRSNGVIPVAVLTTSTAAGEPLDFDAGEVDPHTLAFGPAGALIAHATGHVEDVDADGDLDLVVHFRARDTGVACGDTSATLTGSTFGGQAITGTDAIRTVGCK